jgi:aspartate aminotransferase-like enzyme
VTAFWLPEGVEDKALRARLRQLGAVFAGGQGPLAGRVARLGHLGSQGRAEILFALSCLELALADQGHELTPGASVAAAQAVYAAG